MINLLERVKESFVASRELNKLAEFLLPEKIVAVAKLLLGCVQSGNKILCCGNGGSASDAEHFAGEMLNRFLVQRKELPVLALTGIASVVTSIANDFGFAEVFSKQIIAFGKPHDILFVISTSGDSANILRAVQVAHEQNFKIVALTGNNGGKLRHLLQNGDIEICAPGSSVPRIQEIHILIIHSICDLIDQMILVQEKIYD